MRSNGKWTVREGMQALVRDAFGMESAGNGFVGWLHYPAYWIPGSRYIKGECHVCGDSIRTPPDVPAPFQLCHECGGTKRLLMQRARGRSQKPIWDTDEDFAGYQANARREYEEVRC